MKYTTRLPQTTTRFKIYITKTNVNSFPKIFAVIPATYPRMIRHINGKFIPLAVLDFMFLINDVGQDKPKHTNIMISQISITEGTTFATPLWWCLSLGACFGGNLTIIGAAANVIVSETAKANGHEIKFIPYLKYGVTAVLISLLLTSGYIWLKFLAN